MLNVLDVMEVTVYSVHKQMRSNVQANVSKRRVELSWAVLKMINKIVAARDMRLPGRR